MATPRRSTGAQKPTQKPGRTPGQKPARRPGSKSASASAGAPKGPRRATGNATRNATRKAASHGPRAAAGKRPRPGSGGSAKRPRVAAVPASPLKVVPRSRELVALEKLVLASLEDMKAVNVKLLDVRSLTDVADTMIIASGTSDRHVRAIAERVIERTKAAGRRPMGTEGRQDAEWVLVDLQDVLLHVMLPRVREFYALEQLWEGPAARRAEAAPAGA